MTEPSVPGTPRNSLSVLRYRDFAIFWSAALVSNTGTWMQVIAAPFVIYQLTRSTTWLGVAAFMAFFPALLMSPLGGSLADRYPRKTILLATQTGMMIVAFSLWGAWVAGIATPEVIVGLLFLSGTVTGLNITAWQSFVPQLVPRTELLHAVRVNSMQFVAGRAFGPALAGLVLQVYGAGTAFLINAVSYLLVIGALIAIHPRSVAVDAQAGSVREHFKEALRYVRARQGIYLPVIMIAVVSFFGASIVQLVPAFAKDAFGVGKGAYGLLVAAFGIGAIVGAVVVALRADRYLRSRVAVFGILGIAAGEAIFGSAPSYAIGIVGMVVMGTAYALIATALNTAIHARVDETHRGRTVSIFVMGLLAGVPLGALLQGALASVIGLRATVVGSAVLLAASAIVGFRVFSGYRALDEALEEDTRMGPDLMIGTPPSIASTD